MAAASTLKNMALCLTAVCLVCSAVVGVAYAVTADPIAAAARAKTTASIARVLPEFTAEPEQGSVRVDGTDYTATCLSIGNPHCVIFTDRIDGIDLKYLGPKFEHHELFPERINTEFVRVVNRTTLRMRVWERGNGATLACGTGACAAAIAAVENGYCDRNADILVKMPGGDLIVNVGDEAVTLIGDCVMVFEGKLEY